MRAAEAAVGQNPHWLLLSSGSWIPLKVSNLDLIVDLVVDLKALGLIDDV